MTPSEINSNEDIIDVRDVIARFEYIEDTENPDEEEQAEIDKLKELLDDLLGHGGDEQWRGNWYPVTMIRDSYFQEYAEEMADDIGAIDRNATWPCNCIDWERAAEELQIDYSSVEFDGETYWYR
jgi:hypothetical protein